MRFAALFLVFAGCMSQKSPEPQQGPQAGGGGTARNETATDQGPSVVPEEFKPDPEVLKFEAAPPAAFLKQSDFSLGKARALDDAAAALEVNGNARFKADDEATSTDAGSGGAAEGCFTTALRNAKLKGGSGRAGWAFDIDLAACEQKRYAAEDKRTGDKTTVVEMHLRGFAELLCDGVDLSRLDGKNVVDAQAEARTACFRGNAAQARLTFNQEFRYRVKKTLPDGTTAEVAGQTRSADLGDGGGPCLFTRSGRAYDLDGCHRLSLTQDLVKGDGILRDFTADKLSFEAGDKFFRSGSYKIRVNDWSGALTYSGASTAPQWSLRSAAGKTTSGTWQELSATGRPTGG